MHNLSTHVASLLLVQGAVFAPVRRASCVSQVETMRNA